MRSRGSAAVALVSALMVGGCSSSSTAPANAPEGHTVVRGGVAHFPGLNDPLVNCTACHGPDLRGGSGGQPSCYSCHGQKW